MDRLVLAGLHKRNAIYRPIYCSNGDRFVAVTPFLYYGIPQLCRRREEAQANQLAQAAGSGPLEGIPCPAATKTMATARWRTLTGWSSRQARRASGSSATTSSILQTGGRGQIPAGMCPVGCATLHKRNCKQNRGQDAVPLRRAQNPRLLKTVHIEKVNAFSSAVLAGQKGKEMRFRGPY